MRSKLVIVSTEIIEKNLAGPGLRYLEMARALSDEIEVTLAIPGETTLIVPEISLVSYHYSHPKDFQKLIEAHDAALVTAFTLNKFPLLRQIKIPYIIDLYDPFIFENFFYYLDETPDVQAEFNRQAVNLLNQVAILGDYFICGSERQRDMWIGLLTANGRVNPYTFAQDASFRELIDVVGIGIPDREPVQRTFLRGTCPEFPENCRIILWGGGIWDWLDPLTLLKAWPEIIEHYPDARLVYLGTRHPNPEIPQHRVVAELESLAEEMGERNQTVFFLEWLSYSDREALLQEADIGVTLHRDHIETHFSIRTRIFDYIWARLPILVSEGDVTSQWVQKFALGKVVSPQDPDLVAQAIQEILSFPKDFWIAAFDAAHEQFRWSVVVNPLRRYLQCHGFSADHLVRGWKPEVKNLSSIDIWRIKLVRARYVLRTQGLPTLIDKILKNIHIHLTKLL
jgi:glycosyltransferase involved in cell wall biosynthesis